MVNYKPNYTVSQKNVPPLACYNFDAREWILIVFGRNVADKVANQMTLYYATSNSLCFCTTWQNGIVYLKEKIVICDMFDSV